MFRRTKHEATSGRDGADATAEIDTRVTVGWIQLRSPAMTASGTAGYGTELADVFDLSPSGRWSTKSLAAFEWPGNPAPRLHPTAMGMLNSVGLQGPGVELLARAHRAGPACGRAPRSWRASGAAPSTTTAGGRPAGRGPAGGGRGGGQPVVPQPRRTATRSSPTIRSNRRPCFAATAGCGRPRWAQLSANTDRIVDVAGTVR